MSQRTEPELLTLRRRAEELASGRKERVTSAHLLAAIASRPSLAADLLKERKLGEEALLRAARAATDGVEEPVRRALQRASELAARMGGAEPGAVHLLIALSSERRFAAHGALDQCGVDVARLRAAAIQAGQGLVGRRRLISRRDTAKEPEAVAPAEPRRPMSGVTIPLVPPQVTQKVTPRPALSMVRDPMLTDEPAGDPEPPAPARPHPRRRPKVHPGVERFALDAQKFPTLSSLGRNLTLAAARGELDPVVGRSVEIEQALDVLAKRQGNNPCLIGASGVGKTSVVRGIAQRIARGERVVSLDDRIIVEIPVSELWAGTGVRGALSTRLAALRKEAVAAGGRVVLFFDEIQQLFSAEASEEIVGELKLALAKGELPCIGACSREDYRRAIESDPALGRRFSAVEVEEPSREEAFLVLDAVAEKLSAHHGVKYQEDALALSVAWSVRYLPGRALPDKAVSVIDLAGARVRRRAGRTVSAEAVAEVVAELADMPIERLLESDGDRFLRLEQILAERVVGHSEQIRRIARILRRNAAGLGAKRPIGTFLLLGPTGVGKTETAKAVAEVLFHAEGAMTRVDLSEYSEPHSVARLIGAPPGYVGHEAGGLLTESVRRRPYQVILLDEIEKAHPEVLETFLGVFDEGRLTDGRGRTVDFTNTVILMTSNIGAEESGSAARRRVGFGAGEGVDTADLERRVSGAARGVLAPELYNRIDEVLVFAPLGREDVREIARRLLAGVGKALHAQRGARLDVEAGAIDFLLDHGGYDPALGARPMKRTIARLVEAPLAEKILRGELGAGSVALVGLEEDGIGIDVLDAPAAVGSPSAAE